MDAEKLEATSLVLVEEFAHRVLNEYTHAIAGLNRAARHTRDQSARQQLLDAADRLYAHANAHRALAMPNEARCEVAEYIAQVCAALAGSRWSEVGLQLKLETLGAVLSADRCWRLALIVSELIDNAARHGARDGEIVVELVSVGSELVCRVSNDGASEAAPGPGRGRRVVAALALALGGRADWLFTRAGAYAWVIVPIDDPATATAQRRRLHRWRNP